MIKIEKDYFNFLDSSYEIEIYGIEDRQGWDQAIFELDLSVYFTWEYASIISDNYPDPINLLKFYNQSSGTILIYTSRSKDGAYRDIFSPYGMDGIYSWGLNKEKSLDGLKHYLELNNIVTYYQLSHPSYTNALIPAATEYRTVYVLDIQKPAESILKKFHENHRYEINRFKKKKSNLIQDKKNLSDTFIELYTQTLDRVNASDTYYFTSNSLKNLILSDISFPLGVSVDGRVECTIVFLVKDEWAEYYINASTDIGRCATRFLIWEGIQLLKKVGVKYINLGGGITEGDALEQFKKRFGGSEEKLRVSKEITFPREYNRLCLEYKIDAGKNPYFPEYWVKKSTA
jgi:hypothetical protein